MNAEDDKPSTWCHARLKAVTRVSGVLVVEFPLHSALCSSKECLNWLMNCAMMLKWIQG